MLDFLPSSVRGVVGGMGKFVIFLVIAIYVISPIDLLPEALLGPIGLIDDLAVIIFGASLLGFDFFKGAKSKRKEFQSKK